MRTLEHDLADGSRDAASIGDRYDKLQHRFENAHWLRQSEWNFQDAAMNGTSYLKLPRILQWLTGNIGFHHIHHLSPRVPNYRLEQCHKANAVLRGEKPLTSARAFGGGNLTLWDEANKKLVRFRDAEPAPG